MSLVTILCILLGNVVYGQDPVPIPQNTVTRVPCQSGFLGCSNDNIYLTLKPSGQFGGVKALFTSSTSQGFPNSNTRIIISIPGTSQTSVGTYYLPTTIGDQTVIPSTDGILPYTVFIKKTGNQQFTLEVSEISL